MFGFLMIFCFLLAGSAGEGNLGAVALLVAISFGCGFIQTQIEKHERRAHGDKK